MIKIKKITPQTIYYFFGLLTLILIAISDITSYFYQNFGLLGSFLWIVSYVFIIIFSLKCFIEILRFSYSKKSPYTIFVIIIFMVLIGTQLNNPASLSGETSIEINCAIEHLLNSEDLGFRETCLFGYPARQHFLPAIPSILLGRHLINLNLGGSLYFLIGLPIMAYGVITFFGKNSRSDLLAAFGLSSLLHFHYFNHFLFLFEQSIFPLSMGLILVGSFLIYLNSKNNFTLVPLGISLVYLAVSYTPSISLLFFSFCVILFMMLKEKSKSTKKIWFTILLTSITIFMTSLTYRSDINLSGPETTFIHMSTDVVNTFKHILLFTEPTKFTSPVFVFIFLFGITLGLLGKLGKFGIIGSLWILAVIIFSIISKGYTYYGIDFRLHRTLVTLPIFILLAISMIKNYFSHKNPQLLTFLTLFVLFTGMIYNLNFLSNRSANPHYSFIRWIKHVDATQNIDNLIITKDTGKYNNIISISDNLRYFSPDIQITYIDEELFNDTCELTIDLQGEFLIPNNHECYKNRETTFLETGELVRIGEFVTENDEALTLLKTK